MNEYDMTIVGAGPAGTTLARLLAGKYRVLLIDRAQAKCCGGLLSPNAQKMIARFGLVLPDTVLHGPQFFTVRVDDYDNHCRRYYQRHYVNIDRERFDAWLLSLVPEKVQRRIPANYLRSDWNEKARNFTVHFRNGNSPETIQTKILVGADGAFSAVRRQFVDTCAKRKMYTAIQYWYENEVSPKSYSGVFDREITDYYSWTIPKGNQLIIGSAIPNGPDVKERFARLLQKIPETKNLGRLVRREATQIVRPLSMSALCPTASDKRIPVVLLGEAAGWISPSTAEGISFALRSALLLADALEPGIDGFEKRYRKNTTWLNVKIFLKNLKKPVMYSPVLRKIIMRSGILSLNVLEEIMER